LVPLFVSGTASRRDPRPLAGRRVALAAERASARSGRGGTCWRTRIAGWLSGKWQSIAERLWWQGWVAGAVRSRDARKSYRDVLVRAPATHPCRRSQRHTLLIATTDTPCAWIPYRSRFAPLCTPTPYPLGCVRRGGCDKWTRSAAAASGCA